ncbi:integrase [Scytonema millei]|uniref:Site-specific integrase n=1 Tax=Scytonema millei VB511283 TaxID=1245923 RepID=A0A9X5E401_9CYAN|nr:integrase [Scytonema millei]NHC34701.1 site-specific integrase [Scytonema millei VB511283]
MDIQGRLNQANGRLRAAKVGVTIEAKGNRLYLRATFPPKLDTEKTKPFQQRLALGFHTNPSGISLAEAEARKVGALLDCKEFSWQSYLKHELPKSQPLVRDWIAKFEQHYFDCRARTPKTETTWKKDYWLVLKQLPSDQELTAQLLTTTILSTAPDTKSRKRYCMVLQALAKFAEIEFNSKPMAGSYSPKRVAPRDLPEDRWIAKWFGCISNDAWRWTYGIIATFGLRPHEVFHLDTKDLESGGYILGVLDGKTGSRRVWACYPEWVDSFDLRSPRIPAVTGRNNSELGERCSQYFRRNAGLPFHLYDLRHCWAIRTLEFGLDVCLAAQQMGHSVQIHTDLYHHWISDRHHQRAFDALMMRSDRPLPPLTDNSRLS